MPKASGVKSHAKDGQDGTRPYPKSKRKPSQNQAENLAKASETSKRDPKQSHLYTDDNPSTTLRGTGFKDAQTAHHTIELVSRRSLTYQWQVINTMYHRAKGHPSMKKGQGVEDIKAAMDIFGTWLQVTYPDVKAVKQAAGRDFKPLLKKETVGKYLGRLKALEPNEKSKNDLSTLADCTRFAEMYAHLPKGKRLANTLLDDEHPEEEDWEIRRERALIELMDQRQGPGEEDLWNEKGGASDFHLQCIGWAWSPAGERRLPP